MQVEVTFSTLKFMQPVLVVIALLISASAESQTRITTKANCTGGSVNAIHFDQTIYQADFKIMVSEYEVEPDLRIRLVNSPALADLILSDDLPGHDFAICRSATRSGATTLFVAKFVRQPDVTIMLNRKDRHADYTLYVDSETVSDDEAAALFWLAWEHSWNRSKQTRFIGHIKSE